MEHWNRSPKSSGAAESISFLHLYHTGDSAGSIIRAPPLPLYSSVSSGDLLNPTDMSCLRPSTQSGLVQPSTPGSTPKSQTIKQWMFERKVWLKSSFWMFPNAFRSVENLVLAKFKVVDFETWTSKTSLPLMPLYCSNQTIFGAGPGPLEWRSV